MFNTTRDIVALATVLLILLFLLIHTANAGAQNQARADIKNAEGNCLAPLPFVRRRMEWS